MTRELFVHLLPALFEPEELEGGVAVVIDVLRASTTIVHALASGATAVIPCGEVVTALETAAMSSDDRLLLGGERDGTLIEGFDLGNSPTEYTPETVAGKTVIFTTTNGTHALLRASEAGRVFMGAFVNLSAIVDRLLETNGPIHIVCAGTDEHLTLEDCLCAGAMASAIMSRTDVKHPLSDSTTLALSFFQSTTGNGTPIVDVMRTSRGGRNLIALGMSGDIEIAARQDTFRIVPELVHRKPGNFELRITSHNTPSKAGSPLARR